VGLSGTSAAGALGWWRATFRPQAWKILFSQACQYPLDHRRVFDAHDDLDRATAVRAGLHVDLENP